jgi:biopolymer transport protein ExbB/TolQ
MSQTPPQPEPIAEALPPAAGAKKSRKSSAFTSRFSWYRDDLECKLGFNGGRFTRVNNVIWLVCGLFLAASWYAILIFVIGNDKLFVQKFTERGETLYIEVFFFFWAASILTAKIFKTQVQIKALEFTNLVPPNADFVLSRHTVNQVLQRLRTECDDPSKFLLFNRIELALSNLKNMGQITDVDTVLETQANNDMDVMESSYSLLKGLIWACPVLGFVGTVMGLGDAIGGFGKVIASTSDIAQLKPALQSVTGGLSTAFDSTFVALASTLILQLYMTYARKTEEELLDACKEYCQRFIVGRLRMIESD